MTNSQVPFILVNTYRTHEQLEALASQYPNAIIFYSYTGQETGGLTDSAIWAHGKEYKTGGGDARFRVGASDPADYVTANSWTPKPGDFYVKEEAIANTSPVQYTRTAYIYAINASNEMVWQVLDGNVTAENVYFPAGFERTEKWGVKTNEYTVPTVDPNLSGLNLKEVFEYYLIKESWPSPSVTWNDSIPGFSLSDGGVEFGVFSGTINNGTTTYSDTTLKNGDEVLYGTPLQASITYDRSATPTKAGGSNENFVLGPKTISGLSFGYYEFTGKDENDNNIFSTTKKTGNVTGQDTKVKIKYENIVKNSASVTLNGTTLTGDNKTATVSDDNVSSVSKSGTKFAGFGTNTFSYSTTNGAAQSRTFHIGTTENGTTTYSEFASTQATIHKINTEIAYSNNKGTNKRELSNSGTSPTLYEKAYDDTTIDLTPGSAGISNRSNSINIIGYYPIYYCHKSTKEITTAPFTDFSIADTKITGTTTTYSITVGNNTQSGTDSYLVAYPHVELGGNKLFSASVNFEGTPQTIGTMAIITEKAFSVSLGGSSSVYYDIISTGGNKAAWSGHGTEKFNFTITKTNNTPQS